MKKGFFNDNIKHQFVSYIWTTIIIDAVISFGCGGLFLYFSFGGNLDRATSLLLLVFGIVSCLFGIWYSFGTIFIIRNYPKHKKFIKWFLNSDYYFVGSDSKDFHGHWRGRSSFGAVTHIGDQNKGLEGIKYPQKYRVYIVLTIMGIVLMFACIAITAIVLQNIELLPEVIRNEGFVFAIFLVVEILNLILSFMFAFRVKKIRKDTIDEFRKSQMK